MIYDPISCTNLLEQASIDPCEMQAVSYQVILHQIVFLVQIGFNFCTHGGLKAGFLLYIYLNSSLDVLLVISVFEASVPVMFRTGDHRWKGYNTSNMSAWD